MPPVRSFFSKYNVVNFVNPDMEDGILPVSELV